LKDKNRLLYIILSVLLPLLVILALVTADLVNSRKNITELVRLYVEHFTDKMSAYIKSDGTFGTEGDAAFSRSFDGNAQGFFTFPRRFPTHLAVFSKDRNFIYGSERLRNAINKDGPETPTGYAYEIGGMSDRFTVAEFPAAGGEFIAVGGLAWEDISGTAALSVFLWPILILLAALWGVVTIWNLFHSVINPINLLEHAVSTLKWGVETMEIPLPGANSQILRMRDTLARVSRDACHTVRTNRVYVNDLVKVQEDERTKISRDIHDGPLQDVTALIQRLRLARSSGNTAEDTAMELDLAEKIAFTTVKEMRSLCDFLNPPWLELGLSQALTELTERQSLQYGVKIYLGLDENIEMSDTVTLAFFRVVQEAVTNSVQHGEAKNIWIDLKRGETGGIELTIQDDGHGFDIKEGHAADLRAEGHRGLSNMEERMALVGGTLRIISYRGEGTCIRGLLP
jgi:signal transduction histidine kinase